MDYQKLLQNLVNACERDLESSFQDNCKRVLKYFAAKQKQALEELKNLYIVQQALLAERVELVKGRPIPSPIPITIPPAKEMQITGEPFPQIASGDKPSSAQPQPTSGEREKRHAQQLREEWQGTLDIPAIVFAPDEKGNGKFWQLPSRFESHIGAFCADCQSPDSGRGQVFLQVSERSASSGSIEVDVKTLARLPLLQQQIRVFGTVKLIPTDKGAVTSKCEPFLLLTRSSWKPQNSRGLIEALAKVPLFPLRLSFQSDIVGEERGESEETKSLGYTPYALFPEPAPDLEWIPLVPLRSTKTSVEFPVALGEGECNSEKNLELADWYVAESFRKRTNKLRRKPKLSRETEMRREPRVCGIRFAQDAKETLEACKEPKHLWFVPNAGVCVYLQITTNPFTAQLIETNFRTGTSLVVAPSVRTYVNSPDAFCVSEDGLRLMEVAVRKDITDTEFVLIIYTRSKLGVPFPVIETKRLNLIGEAHASLRIAHAPLRIEEREGKWLFAFWGPLSEKTALPMCFRVYDLERENLLFQIDTAAFQTWDVCSQAGGLSVEVFETLAAARTETATELSKYCGKEVKEMEEVEELKEREGFIMFSVAASAHGSSPDCTNVFYNFRGEKLQPPPCLGLKCWRGVYRTSKDKRRIAVATPWRLEEFALDEFLRHAAFLMPSFHF